MTQEEGDKTIFKSQVGNANGIHIPILERWLHWAQQCI